MVAVVGEDIVPIHFHRSNSQKQVGLELEYNRLPWGYSCLPKSDKAWRLVAPLCVQLVSNNNSYKVPLNILGGGRLR